MKKLWLLAIPVITGMGVGPAWAAKAPVKSQPARKTLQSSTDLVHQEKYAIGFQSTWPAWGLSGQMDINDKLTAQAVLGFAGETNIYALRGLYNIKKSSTPFLHNYYGFAAIGDYTSPSYDFNGNSTRESVIGFGLGAGVEAAPFEDLPIWLSLEVGASFAGFDNYSGFNTIGFGLGMHYRF